VHILENTNYTCVSCGKKHPTYEQAKCCYELDNTCFCLKHKKVYLAAVFTNYNRYGDPNYEDVYLDFEQMAFFTQGRYEGDRTHWREKEKVCSIKFCPFCGRDLGDDLLL
jgi:hypothetical protein